jgi:transketolase
VTFAIGRGYRLREGADVTIAAYGVAVVRAIEAAETLARAGITADVLDLASLKPLDLELVLESVGKTGAIVVVEDHNVEGGIGSAIARELLEAGVRPRFRALGITDTFTESASRPDHIREKYGVGPAAIVDAARAVAGATAGVRVA